MPLIHDVLSADRRYHEILSYIRHIQGQVDMINTNINTILERGQTPQYSRSINGDWLQAFSTVGNTNYATISGLGVVSPYPTEQPVQAVPQESVTGWDENAN